MSRYFFQLGNTPELSKRELLSVLPTCDWEEIQDQIMACHLPETVSVEWLMTDVLGGTIKILSEIKQLESSDISIAQEEVTQLLAQTQGKVVFGLAEIGRDHLKPLSTMEIKQDLIRKGNKVRYIEGPRQGLSSSVLSHRKVDEVAVITGYEHTYLAQTVAVQDVDAWTLIDRGKPYADRKKGMLPPKVARMMVNLGIAGRSGKLRIYDPFCGTGTVLIEAYLREHQVIGSDADPNAVRGAVLNLNWVRDNLSEDSVVPPEPIIFQEDVARVHLSHMLGEKVDAIVTEPFLGKPTPNPARVPNIMKGLSKMYWGAFKTWTDILNPGARVVVIFPFIQTPTGSFDLSAIIDKISPLGYTMVSEPVLYHRPQAVVQRQIHEFVFKQKE
jgi:tRNA G10  N-methylase Trm11